MRHYKKNIKHFKMQNEKVRLYPVSGKMFNSQAFFKSFTDALYVSGIDSNRCFTI